MVWAQISRARGLSRAASGLGVEMWVMVTLGNSSVSHALRSSPAIGSSGREQRNRVTVLHERAATSMRKQCPVCGGWKRPMIMPWLCCAMGFVLYYTWKGGCMSLVPHHTLILGWSVLVVCLRRFSVSSVLLFLNTRCCWYCRNYLQR